MAGNFALARTPMHDARGNMTREWVRYFDDLSAKPTYLVVSVTDLGAIADGTGSGGTDQSAIFQKAADLVSAAGGGAVFIPYAPLAYVVNAGILVASNTTFYSDAQATTVQKQWGDQVITPAALPGYASVFYTGGLTAVSNIWFRNFTIDGNRDNVSTLWKVGVTYAAGAIVRGSDGNLYTSNAGANIGHNPTIPASIYWTLYDGGNFGILFQGASDSGTESMIVKNASTGGITISGWGPSAASNGDNVVLLDTIITNSRRNNLEPSAGTNTRMIGGSLSYATGGSLCAGCDVEPFVAGQFVTGFQLVNVEIHHNRDSGILIQGKYDAAPAFAVINCNVHDNGAAYSGLNAIDFNGGVGGVGGGTLSVIGGVYKDNAGPAAINLAGLSHANITGAAISGSARGVLVSANVTNALLGPGSVAGTSYDLSVDGPNSIATLAGAVLANRIIQPGQEASVRTPLSGTVIDFTNNGVAYWPATSPRTGAMAVTAHVTVNDGANPSVSVFDAGGMLGKIQAVTGTGVYAGAQSADPLLLITNNVARITISAAGKVNIAGLPTFANNAAAVAGGLTVAGDLYQVTGTDYMGVVH